MMVVLLAGVFGVIFGAVAGYAGGFVNTVMMRVTDAFLAFPVIAGVVFLQQLMAVAIEAAGVTRTFSSETAASVASWLSVKWSVMGELSATKTGTRMMIDFIPAKTGSVPFRFTKSGKIDEAGAQLPEAFSQFAYYLTVRPLQPMQKKLPTMTSVKKLAEALDREYGWFVEAEPGKAQTVVSDLAATDERLARFLFNPSLYPTLQPK